MSSANVDLVRSIFAAWERGDFSVADWARPKIEFVADGGPEPGSATGLAGMAEITRGFVSTWENFRMLAEEYRELDSGRVLVIFQDGGRGNASGLELEQLGGERAMLFQICGRKVTKLVIYWDCGMPSPSSASPGRATRRSHQTDESQHRPARVSRWHTYSMDRTSIPLSKYRRIAVQNRRIYGTRRRPESPASA